MTKRVVKEVHHTSGGASGMGILGVIIGALLVVGAVAFYATESGMVAGKSGGTSVTVNAPTAPSAPSAPSTPSAPRTTTGAGGINR